MYESILEDWDKYKQKFAEELGKDDPKHHLWAEVHNRIEQLNITLDLLKHKLNELAGDPEENRLSAERKMRLHKSLIANEISMDEFIAQTTSEQKSQEWGRKYVRDWNEVRLFTEMFYLIAWRIREILNGQGSYRFPSFGKFDPLGVRNVRNNLLQHPEKSGSPNFLQSLIVTNNGPVLKTMGVSLVGSETKPLDDSLDKGLYINNEEFRSKLQKLLSESLG